MIKKKNKLKSIFKAKFTKTQTNFSIFILLIIFIGLGLFLLSNSTVLHYRMLIYSQELQVKNNYNDYLESLTPTPTSYPTPIPFYPTSIPTFAPIEQLPNQNFNTLIIYQEGPPPGSNYSTITKRITDPSIINELYDDILNLPLFPQSNIPMSCPVEFVNSYTYVLNFYLHHVRPVVSARLHPTGCSSVSFTAYKTRNALGFQGVKLKNDLQKVLNLSEQDFYSY